jgi:nicotinamidase-related amidase
LRKKIRWGSDTIGAEVPMGPPASSRSHVLLIDFQERLFQAMPEHRDRAASAAATLLWLADGLGVPVTATEQYPKGLGPTVEGLRRPSALQKMAFSAARAEGFPPLAGTAVICGMEAHICVAHTVADLRAAGRDVVVVADACLSRKDADRDAAYAWMRGLGAAVLPVETVLFGWLGTAEHPLFREVSKRIR